MESMPVSQRRKTKPDTLSIHIKPETRGLIDRAAAVMGKTPPDFVLDAAHHAAEDALLDRTVFTVSAKAYAEFLEQFDAPAQPNKRLRRNMLSPALWVCTRGS
jgi:uncharacterized protein (DUF1778 family)